MTKERQRLKAKCREANYHNIHRKRTKKGCSEKHPLGSPQEYAVDVYQNVRLEAGTLHLANYLIHFRGLFLAAKVVLFLYSAKKISRQARNDKSGDFSIAGQQDFCDICDGLTLLAAPWSSNRPVLETRSS